VLANTCALSTVDGGGYRLDGTKWLVGRGMSADAFLVVANSGGRGPGAFTAVLLDRPDGVTREPVAMTGMRGMDFANLTFDGVRVPADAVVGKVGQGLEGALKAQQIVRLMSTAGCMSTVDTALRATLRFAGERRLGKATVAQNPYARAELARAAAETIAADVTALTACRIAQLTPNAFNLASAVVKRVGTELTAGAIARCGAILGARAVVRDGYGAIWDKASRDNAMVKVIDTSPVGNLRALAMQLPAYAKVDPQPADAALFRIGEELPALDAAQLDLSPRPRDPVVPTFLALAAEIATAAGNSDIAEIAGELRQLVQKVDLDAADRFCTLYAGACAALAWWFNRDRELYRPGWLEGVSGYVTGRDALPALESVEGMAAAGLLFTALPAPVAEGGTAR
jgi:Acyl-CoA dehydrogenase, middle domain/Acyl-CoA dehydrogenase, C-terminal domain